MLIASYGYIGRRVSQRVYGNDTLTTYAYDNLDRLIRTTDNVVNATAYGYDSRNNRVLMTDALGNKTRYAYDGLNRLVSTIRDMDGDGANGSAADIVTAQAWDDSSRLIRRTDDNGNQTVYQYDPLDRMTAEVFADSTQTSYVYDVHDNPISITDANGSVILGNYDKLDRLTGRVIIPGSGVADGSNGGTVSETFAYDGLSRLINATDDDSYVELWYDSLSNVIRDRQERTSGPGAGCGTVAATFDGESNMLSCTYPGTSCPPALNQTDPSGRKIGCTYDEVNLKKTITDETDPANPAMIASYGYIGRRVSQRVYGNDTLMTYAYDGSFNQPNDFGVRQVVRTTHSRIDPATVTVLETLDDRTYAWDKVYNKTQRADLRAASTGRRLTHDYLYDAAYRMTQATATDTAAPGGPVTVRDTSYTLDGVHNRLSTGGTVNGSPDPAAGSYTMNAMACDNLGNPLTPADGADRELNQYTTTPLDQRSYDLNGNLTSLKNDVAGNPLTLSVSCRYDYRNRMVEYKDNLTGQRHTYAYDALGRRIAKTLDADGVTGGWPRSYSTWGHDFDRK